MKRSKLVDWFFLGAIFLIFLLPSNDPDLGWQLRCGQQFWQAKGFCSLNQFSVLLANYRWINHRWLYQALIWPIFQLTGLWGLSLLNSSLMMMTFFFFYQAINRYSWEKIISAGLIILFGWTVFSLGLRSQLFGLFFFSMILWLFTKIEKRPRLTFFLPLIALIWANTHGSVIIGLVLILFWIAKKIFNQPHRFRYFSVIFLASLGAVLVNPFGWRIFQDAWQHFSVVDLSAIIAEWVPPHQLIRWLILVSSFSLFGFSLFKNKRENKLFGLIIFGLAFLALRARRHLPFYFLLAFYLFFKNAPRLSFSKITPSLKKSLAIFTAMLLAAFGLTFSLPAALKANRSWQGFCQNSKLTYPCEAIAFLKNQPQKGNLFNRYEWGGFLIWQLPEYQIFVDGRMPAWPTSSKVSPYTIYLETLQTRQGWQELLEAYKIDWLLISPDTFMDLLLSPGPEKFSWQEVYRDKISVIYQRIPNPD